MKELREIVKQKMSALQEQPIEVQKMELPKYQLMFQTLQDNACFFKLSFQDAYALLSALDIEQPIHYYQQLISMTAYKNLQENFEI